MVCTQNNSNIKKILSLSLCVCVWGGIRLYLFIQNLIHCYWIAKSFLELTNLLLSSAPKTIPRISRNVWKYKFDDYTFKKKKSMLYLDKHSFISLSKMWQSLKNIRFGSFFIKKCKQSLDLENYLLYHQFFFFFFCESIVSLRLQNT